MKWFKKLVWQWSQQGREFEHEHDNCLVSGGAISTAGPSLRGSDIHGINFTLYSASGGHVLETRQYDEKKDENRTNLYIISSEEDFAKQIAHCITLETLRR